MQQIDFDMQQTPRIKRDMAIAQSADHAERVSPEWKERAYSALKQFCTTHERFTSYDFRHAGLILSPTTDKAFGAVFQRAARAGIIANVGYEKHPERHLSPTVLWASKIFGMTA